MKFSWDEFSLDTEAYRLASASASTPAPAAAPAAAMHSSWQRSSRGDLVVFERGDVTGNIWSIRLQK